MRRQQFLRAMTVFVVVTVLATAGSLWLRRENERQIYHLKNGLTVEFLPVETDEAAEVLNMVRWKLHITMPTNATVFKSIVEVRHGGVPTPLHQGLFKDTETKSFGDYSVFEEVPSNQREFDLRLVLYSETGDMNHDHYLFAWMKGWAEASKQKIENPFSAATGGCYSHPVPIPQADDSFVLMDSPTEVKSASGGPGGFRYGDGQKKAELVLKIAPNNPADPPLFMHSK